MSIWDQAIQVFLIGFGGVFLCLAILQFSIILFSKAAQAFEKKDTDQGVG